MIIMPFRPVDTPALGAEIVAAGLETRGHHTDRIYLNLDLAGLLGLDGYNALLDDRLGLGGERFFGGEEGRALAEEWSERIAAGGYDLVSFSSSYQDLSASISVARRLKEMRPSTRVVLGGANCEDEMGEVLAERFPFLDAVFSGEADLTMIEEGLGFIECGPVSDLDASPIPDYSTYFEELDRTGLAIPGGTHIPIETARGCLWGERNPCAFCGLNGMRHAYRRKSAVRVEEELGRTGGLRTNSIIITDNLVDSAARRDLVRSLEKKPGRRSVFLETRPPLSREEAGALAGAGIRGIQAGIEALSSGMLGLMGKGTRLLDGISLLMSAAAADIAVTWNLLAGIPGETDEMIEETARLIPLIRHLTPPVGLFRTEIHRFSRYHADPNGTGWGSIRPLPAYKEVFDLPGEDLERLAYHFEPVEPVLPDGRWRIVADLVDEWRYLASKGEAILIGVRTDEGIEILDTREPGTNRIHRISASEARDIEAAIEPVSIGEITFPEPLIEKRLIISSGDLALSLVEIVEGDLSLAEAVARGRSRALAASGAGVA